MTTINGIFNKVTDFKPIYCLPVKELLVGSFSHDRQDFQTSWQGVACSDKEGVNIRRGLFQIPPCFCLSQPLCAHS